MDLNVACQCQMGSYFHFNNASPSELSRREDHPFNLITSTDRNSFGLTQLLSFKLRSKNELITFIFVFAFAGFTEIFQPVTIVLSELLCGRKRNKCQPGDL